MLIQTRRGKLTLAHFFGFFDQEWKLEKLYESKGIKPKLEGMKTRGNKKGTNMG